MQRQLPPPSWMPSASATPHIDRRQLVIPGSLLALATLHFVLGAPLALTAVLATLVPLGYAAASVYVLRHLPRFESRFNALVIDGDLDALWSHYRAARLLRWSAPPWIMLSKLGLILTLRRQYRAANGVLEEAYVRAPRRRRADLLGPLARVKLEVGDMESLKEIATQWRARTMFPGPASLYLAAAYAADPREEPGAAEALLDEIGGGVPGRRAHPPSRRKPGAVGPGPPAQRRTPRRAATNRAPSRARPTRGSGAPPRAPGRRRRHETRTRARAAARPPRR